MDINKEIVATYLGTLSAILAEIEKMKNPTIRKVKDFICNEISRLKTEIGDKNHGR